MPAKEHEVASANGDAQHHKLDQAADNEKRDMEDNPVPTPSVEECDEDNYLHGSPLVLLIVSLTLAVFVQRQYPGSRRSFTPSKMSDGMDPFIS
ncbi:hypothetical protein SLS60_002549 [Paraconiothyrium brasiliense]|uniref:Uncharacterized protein n=1 Tax=Paraconiothyrium brasiliense TaxID=300254 RepID=A0ABR3RT51_9PLEO